MLCHIKSSIGTISKSIKSSWSLFLIFSFWIVCIDDARSIGCAVCVCVATKWFPIVWKDDYGWRDDNSIKKKKSNIIISTWRNIIYRQIGYWTDDKSIFVDWLHQLWLMRWQSNTIWKWEWGMANTQISLFRMALCTRCIDASLLILWRGWRNVLKRLRQITHFRPGFRHSRMRVCGLLGGGHIRGEMSLNWLTIQ